MPPPTELPFTLDTPPEEATVFRCPLCAARFTHAGQACPACPMSAGCHVLSCPHCGYSFPRSSRLAGWIRGLVGSRTQGPEP